MRTATSNKVEILEALGASREAASLREWLTIDETRRSLTAAAKTRKLSLRERLYLRLTAPKQGLR